MVHMPPHQDNWLGLWETARCLEFVASRSHRYGTMAFTIVSNREID